MLYNELPLPLTFYDRLLNQERFKENAICDECSELIVPHDRLIPFQLRKVEVAASAVTSFKILDLAANEIADISLTPIKKATVSGWDYWYYKGLAPLKLVGDVTDLNLPCGLYYIVIIAGGVSYYSEVFSARTYASANEFPYLMIEYSSQNSIDPVYYGDEYVNRIYLDTFVTRSVPKIDRETEKDGFDTDIIISQKMTSTYQVAAGLLPDFMVQALTFMSINSIIFISLKLNRRFGKIYNVTIKNSDYENRVLTEVDIEFDQQLIIVKGTCDGIALPQVGDNQGNGDLYDGIIDDGNNDDDLFYEDI